MARRVHQAAVRSKFTLVEISEAGSPVTLRGEMTSINVVPQYENFTVPVLGGGTETDTSLTHYVITLNYVVGTDGGFWEQMEIDKLAGNQRHISPVLTTDDPRSRRVNGGRVSRYNECHMLTHTGYEDADSSNNTAKTAQVTLHAPFDSKVVLSQFNPVQG